MGERLDVARLRYLAAVATQPADEWEGFYHPAVQGSNLEYCFQIGFAAYALAAMQRQAPAWRGPASPFGAGLAALARRMLHPRTHRYWTAHRPDPDPVRAANIMYSGHLACVLALTELIAGTDAFDAPQPLRRDANGDAIAHHSHHTVATAIHDQMAAAPSHGVACEPGRIYVCCNNHAALSNLLYDRCHPGRDLAAINGAWDAWVRARMVLPGWHAALVGPPGGVLSAVHYAPTDRSAPFASNFTDAWGLALMTAYDAELPRALAPRLWRRLHGDRAGRWLPSMGLLTRWEASDAGLNTGFAYVLARELGADRIAADLRAWALARLGAQAERGHAWLTGVHSALYTTALFALGDAIAPGGLAALFRDPPAYDPRAPRAVCGPFPAVALEQAAWDPATRTMQLAVAAFSAADLPAGEPAWLRLECLPGAPTAPPDLESAAAWDAATATLGLALAPGPARTITLRCG